MYALWDGNKQMRNTLEGAEYSVITWNLMTIIDNRKSIKWWSGVSRSACLATPVYACTSFAKGQAPEIPLNKLQGFAWDESFWRQQTLH